MFRFLLFIGVVLFVLLTLNLARSQARRFGPSRVDLRSRRRHASQTLFLGGEGWTHFYAVEYPDGIYIERTYLDTVPLNRVCRVDRQTGVETDLRFDSMQQAEEWAWNRGILDNPPSTRNS